MRVLAGDIGGTKTLLQVADIFPNNYKVVFEKKFDSAAYDEFMPLLKDFLKEAAAQADMIIRSACLGIAGPVEDNIARTTNLPWVIDAKQLSKELGIPQVRLINDFQAVGYGLEFLQDDDLVELQQGVEQAKGPRVIIGAGTGLGEGIMYWDQDHYEILPSEGGHVDFAATDADQAALQQYLLKSLGRVSYENVVSGNGLVNIFSYIYSIEGNTVSSELVDVLNKEDEAGKGVDKAALISQYAQEHNDALADRALDMMCRIYGAQAGNLALTCVASGGVYIAGGIAPKIISKIREGGFIQSFHSKGNMSVLLDKMPVRVVMNPKVGLIGAAHAATRLKS